MDNKKMLGHMIGANYHTHTPRSFHASGTDREYIEAAIRFGYHTIGFADHSPYIFTNGYESFDRILVEATQEYAETFAALKEEYKNDIRILIGYEMEYYPEFFEETLKHICKFPVDYLILGQHFIENEYTGKCCYDYTEDEAVLKQFIDELIAGIQTGVYTYVAHPNILNYGGDMGIYETHVRRLCAEAKKHNVSFEADIRYIDDFEGEHRDIRSHHFYKVAAEFGIPVVFGCDAHNPAALNDVALYENALRLMDYVGANVINDPILRDPHLYFQK